MMQLVVLVLCVMLLLTGAWAFLAMQEARTLLKNQLLATNQTLTQSLQENSRLASLLASKDPMTFQMIQNQTESSQSNFEPILMTDEAEYERWVKLHEITTDEEQEILEELGL